jgi:adenosylhomocysteinase
LSVSVHQLPESIEDGIATLKLKAMGIPIDHLTAEQKKYLSSWDMGTN